MSGQFSASLSFDELPERISTTPSPIPRSVRPPADSLGISDTGTDRAALEAPPPEPTSRRWGGELGREVGILLHLACIALVGTAIIVVFFGIAFSLLRHPIALWCRSGQNRKRRCRRPLCPRSRRVLRP